MKKILLLIILISGCSTMYQPTAYTGGYSSTQLDVDKFKVRFGCNGFTGASFCQNMALLRSAEVTIDNGFNHFLLWKWKNHWITFVNKQLSKSIFVIKILLKHMF